MINTAVEKIINADALDGLKTLADGVVDMCVTSPPYYGLRDYGTATWLGGDQDCDHKGDPLRTRENINKHTGTGNDVKNKEICAPYKTVCGKCGALREDKQVGLEETPDDYVTRLVSIFREVRRVLKDNGTLWVNIGDTYNGNKKGNTDAIKNPKATHDTFVKQLYKGAKTKDLLGIPWLLAFALRADGWYLRNDIIWHKPNAMPENVTDRCTQSYEHIFMFSKRRNYYFDHEAIKEPSICADDRRAGQGRQVYDAKYTNTEGVQNAFVTINEMRNKGCVQCL